MGRYKRQEMIRGWDQQVLREARIFVVGAGTTGNEVVKNLAMLGVGHITVADMDAVEEVNLSRSVLFRSEDLDRPKAGVVAQRAHELNPEVEVCPLTCNIVCDVGNLAYARYDCVILTVDNLEARMFVNRYCWMNMTPLIDTGVDGPNGNVLLVHSPDGTCIECGWSKRSYERIHERYQCLKVGLDPEEQKIPMVITSASVIGGMAVQECIRLLHDRKDGPQPRSGTVTRYQGSDLNVLQWQQTRRENCPGHPQPVKDRHVLTLKADRAIPVSDVKAVAAAGLGTDFVELWYDKEVVFSVICNQCGARESVAPTPLPRFKRLVCSSCGRFDTRPDRIDSQLPDEFSLTEIGVPPDHLLTVRYATGDDVSEAGMATA